VLATDIPGAIESALSIVGSLGLQANRAAPLQEANRITVRLLPCDVVARVADVANAEHALFELQIAGALARTSSPAAGPDPRIEPQVYVRGRFATTFWEYHEPVTPGDSSPAEYAAALRELHAGMRNVVAPAGHFTRRVDHAQHLVDSPDLTPALRPDDRGLLSRTIASLRSSIEGRGAPEQLLHGEPHPGNLLRTARGPLFIDFETCCVGPVEFDIAHAPGAVADYYPGIDRELLRECRVLSLALVAAWRWDREDQFPNGRKMGVDLIDWIRSASG